MMSYVTCEILNSKIDIWIMQEKNDIVHIHGVELFKKKINVNK